ncbi:MULTISPECIES: Lsr2 family protein [unclassified Streptomyces]|uniref:histone-like nucleoid-structuring protein Lsr2 n=1 Tax=unclassified Streptomyces TaxID=2593676 RepID=UPI00364885EC
MAIRNVVVSDLSGKPDADTVTFGLDGTWYQVDLTPEERKALQDALKAYLGVSRKAAAAAPKKRQVPETSAAEREEIRKWARKKRFVFKERGRIPKEVMKAYDEAHDIDRSKSSSGSGDSGVPDVPDTTPDKHEAVRKWAKKAGHQVKDRGPIPKALMKAYDEAHDIQGGK